MHIFVTGASGLIGQQLVASLEQENHQVTRLTRRQATEPNERQYDPHAEALDPSILNGCDVLVHLAGENIGEGRWTASKKVRIRDSRVKSTSLLANTLANMDKKPQAFVVASAIGYYGDRGSEILTEASSAGEGFLPEVCVEWESAADPARNAGIRTAHVRTGMVLAKDGGALKAMLLPFQLGVGGVMGSGQQYWSWVCLEDIVRLFQHVVLNDSIHGPINGTSPNPVTNREFTKVLGKVLSRPTVLPMPRIGAKLMLGEMAEALILSSARVVPEVVTQSGFEFTYPDLEPSLQHLLG